MYLIGWRVTYLSVCVAKMAARPQKNLCTLAYFYLNPCFLSFPHNNRWSPGLLFTSYYLLKKKKKKPTDPPDFCHERTNKQFSFLGPYSAPYVTARWLLQQIPPLNFLGINWNLEMCPLVLCILTFFFFCKCHKRELIESLKIPLIDLCFLEIFHVNSWNIFTIFQI